MCKPGKSFNTGVKSYFSSHESSLQEQPCRRGSAPYRRSDWTSRLWAMNISWISELSGTPWSYASRFRNCALQRAPVRWTLASEPTIWRSPRSCQSRNITEQRIQRLQSRGELSRWRHAAEFPRRSTNWPRDTRNEEPSQPVELTGKQNQTSSLLQQQKASNKLSIPNSDWTGKIDLKAVTKQTQLFVIFFWSG